jgi:hypothetical protein
MPIGVGGQVERRWAIMLALAQSINIAQTASSRWVRA